MSQQEQLDLQIKFRDTLCDFLDELINLFPTEREIIFMRMILKQAPVQDLIGRFIRDLLPLKENVKKKDDVFFLNNNILYMNGKIPPEKENHFKDLWKSNLLDSDDRETIWQWMNTFVHIAEVYETKFGRVNGW